MIFPTRKTIELRYIKVNNIYKFLVFALLIIPDDIFKIFPIYVNKTPGTIAYRWLDYSFNILLLIVLLCGLILTIKHKERSLWIFIFLALFREVLFLVFSKNSCFIDNSYEIYLTLLIGIVLAKTTHYICKDCESLNRFFWVVIIANILTVFLSFVMNLGHSNRYNAVNMDVGSTGTICAITIIYCMFNTRIKYRLIIATVSLIALFLSGSRINLLLVVLFLIIGLIIQAFSKRSIDKRNITIFIGIAIIGLIGLINIDASNEGLASGGNIDLARMIASFSLDGMGSDSSVLGRMYSINVGLDIIKNHPIGISGYFTNLQLETVQRGFPTFPHSLVIDYYIFLGPIFIVVIYSAVRTLRKLFYNHYSQFMVLLYVLAFVTLSGGPMVNFKLVYFYSLIYSISQLLTKNQIIEEASC